MFKIHIHTHKAHHKYAFVPLLVERGPGNILNVTLYISISLPLALRGRRTQQEARDHQFMKKWRNMLLVCSTFPPECEATKGWQMLRVDGGEWSSGAAQIGGGTERGRVGREKKKKKSDGACSFIRPFTPVATATCLEGTQERRHHWQKQQRGREWVRANESKLDRQCVWVRAERRSRQQVYNWLRLLVPHSKKCEVDLQGLG